ncbi:D-amino acid dehydrogenase [Mesorhizobium sp. M1A.F.Ca.IN.020.06.1.1]|uniref:D-amino acid dehydrogenase n=1 Tax=unclassified Mesorhizobium TaxID=325217 RepID=UPI000FCB3D7B|nr:MULTISPECIES: D-amino acid dehydrogenase [unclassified Mesorhizobium]RUV82514.1 D-amino acid dehydrogenase [Mesorhizobium sp. M1A.F.Ca.IN.020.32.1.1]RUW06860.1 D-amino acid dehydrogenase [Mesorhizobium sp. M1A.F.Ca.IN.022.05.2.1]RUW30626.1 D-amino acid dehydrogenase [Mesorhizobium sp. M1A.F.Ca.IN.020.06.1.1]RWF85009.1 MAG: D-amino acid dehydrogenase [Mesorhizobium sp.]RWG07062.1 MAG: D-amino acid dehydrogenase [Mesorhizobium sp.]
MSKIVVIGAGIAGVSTAYALAKQGYKITVLERRRYAAMETSFANGGQLSASNAEVWNHWSTVLKGVKWMLRKDAPLLMNPSPSWHKYSWMAEFVAHIGKYRANTIETTRLAIAARKHMFAIAKEEGIDFDHVTRGILHIYWDKAGFDHATRVNKLLSEGGLHRQSVTAEEINSIEPTLRGDFYGGFYTPSDSTGDIHKYTTGLARACERMGVEFVYDAAVQRIDRRDKFHLFYSHAEAGGASRKTAIEADAVVICAGSQSREFAAMLGDRVNIYPVKGYSITVGLDNELAQQSAPWVSILDDNAKIVTSRLGANRLRVAGTAEFNGFNKDIRDDRIRPLVDWTRGVFPDVTTNSVIPWTGLRPMMPNMLPKVGRGRLPGVFYNTGHGHLGWTLSSATSSMLAQSVVEKLPLNSRAAA